MRSRYFWLLCFLIFLASFLLSGCVLRWPEDKRIVPLPVDLRELALKTADLPEGWRALIAKDRSFSWAHPNAIDAVWFAAQGPKRAVVELKMIQFANQDAMARHWQPLSGQIIDPDLDWLGYSDFMTSEDVPSIHANLSSVSCDSYKDFPPICQVELTYGSVYLQLTAFMGANETTVDQVMDIVHRMDERLRPIWTDVSE